MSYIQLLLFPISLTPRKGLWLWRLALIGTSLYWVASHAQYPAPAAVSSSLPLSVTFIQTQATSVSQNTQAAQHPKAPEQSSRPASAVEKPLKATSIAALKQGRPKPIPAPNGDQALTSSSTTDHNAIDVKELPPALASKDTELQATEQPALGRELTATARALPAQTAGTSMRRTNTHNATEHSSPIVIIEPVFSSPPAPPSYPAVARKRQQTGTVWLEITLDTLGRQSTLALLQSSGFTALDQAALAAVKEWNFEPHRIAGIAKPSRVRIPVEFALQ